MNKIINKFLIGLLFLLGIFLIPTFKADATLTVGVWANGVNPLTVSSGTWVVITWNAPSATTCDNNFNPTDHRTNGSYGYTATSTGTFTVNCYAPDPLYYDLTPCSTNPVYPQHFQTGPFIAGTYQYGDQRIGAIAPSYRYYVTGMSTTPYGTTNIQTSGTGKSGCTP